MKETQMTVEIQDVIVAVQFFKTWVIADSHVHKRSGAFNWYAETKDYYDSIDLPKGLGRNNACFDAVLKYPIRDTFGLEKEDLKSFTFAY